MPEGAMAVVPAFHLLAKPTGAICNLDCAYCFFLSRELLYPASHFRMTDEVLWAYLQQLFASHHVPEVVVAWQQYLSNKGHSLAKRASRLGPVMVFGSLETEVGHLAFDNPWIGTQATFRQATSSNVSQ